MSLHFRIAIVGSHRARVAKVVSILSSSASPLPSETDDKDNNVETNSTATNIHVEYVPCVATFDSYENEKGENVRYLLKLEHYEDEGRALRGSSLAPFFDETCENQDGESSTDNNKGQDNDTNIVIPGLAGVAIGCGIETEDDAEKIQSFLNVLSTNSATATAVDDNAEQKLIMMLRCIEPNEEFTSMTEENKFYKGLDPQEKERVTKLQTLGPGKMSRFVNSLVEEIIEKLKPSQPSNANDVGQQEINKSTLSTDTDTEAQTDDDFDVEYYDTNVTRFACKICRTILFSEKELEDPPHKKSQHNFSARKSRNASRSRCESLFLDSGLKWMGDISESIEGKISCHKCSAKLGFWKWTGCQCSCGTWVTPAIQVHLSRVDVVPPKHDNTITSNDTGNTSSASPLDALHVAGIPI